MIVKTVRTTRNYEAVFVDGNKPIFLWGDFKEKRSVRGMKIKNFEKCFSCNHAFADEENTFICSIKGLGNRLMCQTCATMFNTVKAGDE